MMVDMSFLSGVGDSAMNVAIIIVSMILAGSVVFGVIFFIRHKRRYNQFDCIIWEKDAFGQIVETKDKAGIFIDSKTNNKRLFLKDGNVGLNADTIPFIQLRNIKKVYLFKFGLKNYTFIKPQIDDNKFSIQIGEEDVNWGLNEYEKGKKLFDFNKFSQYLPYIGLALVSIIILVIFIYLFRKLDVLKEVSANLLEMAKEVARMRTGEVIVSNGVP